MTIAMGGGGWEEGIIWFHLHLFTWTPWANGNHFHLKTEKRGEKARQPELNCDGTQCVKVCANTSSADFTVTVHEYI